MKKRHIVLLLVIAFLITFWLILRQASAPAPHTPLDDGGLSPDAAPAQKDDLITVASPLPQSTISSPLIIKGQARGNWYFEASFPIRLTDAAGNVLAQGHASAQGDWMTSEYVPFTASLVFTSPPAGSHGMLVLEKDNPSDNPALDNSLSIPITF
ncbi:MAG TPA: Gmad2 immunoglobulin-like domain-containing protein [Candidatus Paceibacterota bacterium]|nr:Gmad2 immunoglobulin-like domain-containing protein [Candidatus Paceibacterota bacterium]